MAVPFIDILRFEPGFKEQIIESVTDMITRGQFVGGPVVEQCELALAAYTKARHVVGCANGTDALQVALRAAGIGKNDGVLVPDMTFWATYEAVVNVGATPYTVDVERETLHLSLAAVQEAVERFKPRALMIVHLYGWAAPETEAIRRYCREQKITLIEDCAQAIGVKLNGESLIAGAEIATTSFYPAKVLGASGDAGALFFQDADQAKRARQLVNHGRTDHYEYGLVGWNSRLGAYEANYVLHGLKHLDERIESRRNVVKHYESKIKNPLVQIQRPAESVWQNGYLSVGLIEPAERVRLIEHLKQHEIGFGTVYPGAMSEQSGARESLGGKISHGHAQWISQAVINLPCFAYMAEAEIEEVVHVVNNFS